MKKGILFMMVLLLMLSCAEKKPRYIIGVSQCSEDIWREKQNAELRMGAYFQDNVELRFAAAYDSDSEIHVNWQASLLGIEAGGPTIRGFLELGTGEQGIALVGLRYKF